MERRISSEGILAGFGAYVLWGILPFYWKLLSAFRPEVILGFRIVHAALFLVAVGLIGKRLTACVRLLRNRRTLLLVSACSVLITLNWYIYIWAVNHAFIVESSLGYFINPLVSVAFGVLFMKERATPAMGISVLLATGGVVVMAAGYGRVPWISLVLAFTFATYGLLKKKLDLDGLTSLTLETLLLVGPMLLFLGRLGTTTGWTVRVPGTGVWLASLLAGIITAIPLILFGHAARRLDLSTLGFIQYVSPTLQLIIGVLAYGEAFTGRHLLAFALIWAGILVYSLSQLSGLRRAKRLQAAVAAGNQPAGQPADQRSAHPAEHLADQSAK